MAGFVEFNIGDQVYRAGTLDAMRQIHILRKIAPVVSPLIPTIAAVRVAGISAALNAFEPIAQALSDLTEDAAEYVIGSCLFVVHRKQVDGSWAPVKGPGNVLMFDDIGAVEMLFLTWKVIEHNLGNFSNALQATFAAGLMKE